MARLMMRRVFEVLVALLVCSLVVVSSIFSGMGILTFLLFGFFADEFFDSGKFGADAAQA